MDDEQFQLLPSNSSNSKVRRIIRPIGLSGILCGFVCLVGGALSHNSLLVLIGAGIAIPSIIIICGVHCYLTC
jgi:hypothetical protein